jgi:hypothetical protein
LEQAVIKPAFSGSYLTEVFEKRHCKVSTQYKTIASEELLLQEFMPEIQTVGETSLIFFNKKFSHAVNKNVPGDFRIQNFGGIYRLVHPDAELIAEAQKLLIHFQENYSTRVDGIVINSYTSWKWSV